MARYALLLALCLSPLAWGLSVQPRVRDADAKIAHRHPTHPPHRRAVRLVACHTGNPAPRSTAGPGAVRASSAERASPRRAWTAAWADGVLATLSPAGPSSHACRRARSLPRHRPLRHQPQHLRLRWRSRSQSSTSPSAHANPFRTHIVHAPSPAPPLALPRARRVPHA